MSDAGLTGLTSPVFLPAHALADAIRRREVSSAEVVDVFLERIDRLNPTLNAFLTVCEDEARAASRAADAALSAGGEIPPLLGVPIAIKDLMQTKGIRTTFGSLIYRDFVPDVDDVAVARVRDAAAVILGKTNTCVFGLKTSLGRVPIVPYTGDSLLLNTYGPIARTVKDAALLLSVIAGHDSRDPMAIRGPVPDFLAATEPDAEPRAVRIAWSADMGRFPVDPEVLSIAESGARTFEQLGFPVESETPAIADPFDELYLPLYRAETYTVMQQLLADRGDDLRPEVREELELSRDVSRADYVRAVSNLGGLPAASVPCGFTAHGLPAGMLIIGRRGEEAAVLAAAAAFERVRPWANAVPELARS